MTKMMRHIGKTSNTDRRLVVVFMQIPGREDHALVVDTDSLPDRYHDDLMNIVEHDGQSDPVLANVLSRRLMQSSGIDALSTLHKIGALQPMPISNVIMLPEPNRKIPLPELIDAINLSNNPKGKELSAELQEAQTRQNRVIENQVATSDEQKFNLAKNIIIEAELLESEALRKREHAYSLYPALKPEPEQKSSSKKKDKDKGE